MRETKGWQSWTLPAEAAQAQVLEAKECDKGGELFKFLISFSSLAEDTPVIGLHLSFQERNEQLAFQKAACVKRKKEVKEALFAVCVRYRDKDTLQRFNWHHALQQAPFPLHNRFINNRRLTGPLHLSSLPLLNPREPQLSAAGFSKDHGSHLLTNIRANTRARLVTVIPLPSA